MRRAVLGIVAIAIVGLALAALLRDEELAFTLGVTSGGPAAELRPDEGVCQLDIDVPRGGEFDTVRLVLGTFGREGPPLEVQVLDEQLRPIADARLRGGYGDIAAEPQHDVRVGDVGAERVVNVCVRNVGKRRVALYGNSGVASRTTRATSIAGAQLDVDLNLRFFRSEPRSLAAALPDMLHRASLFRPVGSWFLWLLIPVLGLGVPVLLVRALQATVDDDPPQSGR